MFVFISPRGLSERELGFFFDGGNMGDSLALVCELNASSVFSRKERERTCLPARSANGRHVFSLFPSPRLFQDLCQTHRVGKCLFLLRKQLRLSAPHSLPFQTSSNAHCACPGRRPKGSVRKVWESLEARSYSKIQTFKHTYDSSLYSLLDILLVRMTKNT